MKTIKEIYRIGHGLSSSHTMAPRFASEQFIARHPEAIRFEVFCMVVLLLRVKIT